MNFKKIILLINAVAITGCANPTNHPVDVEYLGDRIDFFVDSDVAKYYLENYLDGKGNNETYNTIIDRVYEIYPVPTQDDLAVISKQISLDFSAIYFAEYIKGIENNNRYINEFQSIVESDSPIPAELSSGVLVLFVPGWDYEDNGGITGSDLKRPMRVLQETGVNTRIAKVSPVGSIEQIARDLARDIEKAGETNSQIIIVGASSAGAAIHLALTEHLDNRFIDNVIAWVNLGGIINGSALIDHYLEWPQRSILHLVALFQGWDIENLKSMSRLETKRRMAKLPPIRKNIFIVNYIGIGLSGALSDLSIDGYKAMSDYGPNDGLALISDMIAPNSVTILAPLSDHFYKNDKKIDKKTLALFHLVMKEVMK